METSSQMNNPHCRSAFSKGSSVSFLQAVNSLKESCGFLFFTPSEDLIDIIMNGTP